MFDGEVIEIDLQYFDLLQLQGTDKLFYDLVWIWFLPPKGADIVGDVCAGASHIQKFATAHQSQQMLIADAGLVVFVDIAIYQYPITTVGKIAGESSPSRMISSALWGL